MATTGNVTITIDYVGDNNGHNALVAVPSLTSPAQVDVIDVTTGNVTVTIPTSATAVAILKPANGTTSIIIRGSVGDNGIDPAPDHSRSDQPRVQQRDVRAHEQRRLDGHRAAVLDLTLVY